jgi:hypothetical protein
VLPVTETTPDEDVRFVLRSELRLYDPGIRGAAGELEALLHPDFVEFGPSGLRWDRREIIAALTGAPPPGAAAPLGAGVPGQQATVVSELAGIRLSSTIVLVTYVSEQEGRRARHSSLWLRTGPGWRLYFHQGTLMPSG